VISTLSRIYIIARHADLLVVLVFAKFALSYVIKATNLQDQLYVRVSIAIAVHRAQTIHAIAVLINTVAQKLFMDQTLNYNVHGTAKSAD